MKNQPACWLKLVACLFSLSSFKIYSRGQLLALPWAWKKGEECWWESSHPHKLLVCYACKTSNDFPDQKVWEEGTTARNYKCLLWGANTVFAWPMCSVKIASELVGEQLQCCWEDSAWQSCCHVWCGVSPSQAELAEGCGPLGHAVDLSLCELSNGEWTGCRGKIHKKKSSFS